MKKLLLLLVMSSCSLFSQGQLFTNNGPDEVVKIDPRMQQSEFVPGEILVKFKDDINVQLRKTNGTSSIGILSVDRVLVKYNTSSAEKLFPQAERLRDKQILKTYSGKEFERPSLHNIYKLQIELHDQIFQAIDELNADENVVYAEPNYIMSVVESEPLSPELTESEMIEWLKENPLSSHTPIQSFNQSSTLPTSTNVVTPNDPLYSQQWGIPATQVDAVWDSTTGDTTQIIAILDTGVDWLHPDLKDNIWINWAEANGVEGVDDDGNGKVDDIRGWDWINNDNDPKDDNSHGTHVAGIAAAKGNNGLGIAGVNWNAKIMAIKVFQSSGRGDAATITQGIVYAKNNGATVINMSFGSYARSLIMEDALAVAYSTAVLVAASGNDSRCIGPGGLCAPFYPAALSFVLGTEAPPRGGFTNYDQDGPVFSRYSDLLNYELKSTGVSIISAVPNGNYRVYSGTSMAVPMVSGAISLYKYFHPQQSQELMWGNLINNTEPYLKLNDAINVTPKPQLLFINHNIVDTLDGDGDGRPDAGETIELWFEIRNTWGQADSVWVGIEFGEFEDTTTATIIKDKAFIGSISPYARRTNELNPLKIKINPNVVHDRDIVFESKLWHEGSYDTVRQQILITIENGDELSGVMDSVMTLTPDKYWIVNQSFRVGVNGTLIIKPGTQLDMDIYIVNRGMIVASGSPDSMIIIKRGGFRGTGQFSFAYTSFQGSGYGFGDLETASHYNQYNFDHCVFEDIEYPNIWIGSLFLSAGLFFNDCIFRNSYYALFSYVGSPVIERCTFENIYTNVAGFYMYMNNMPGNYNNFVRMKSYSGNTSIWFPRVDVTGKGNNFISFGSSSYGVFANGSQEVINMPEQYWGTTEISKIGKKIFDFFDDPNQPQVNIYPFLIAPSDSAHGIVWKVLVNGKDAQDEVVEPVGVGPQRFDVYFNRPMDTSYTPQLTFGVREPFTQQAVADSSFWSADGKIWTAYHTMKIYTGDGINRIRVSNARDFEGFEIPMEDQRFEFLIDAAGSASTEFTATAGLGKVNLEWTNPEDIIDLLGYNMYRFEHLTDTTFTTPIQANSSLVTDTLFTDFDVIPNKKYYYYYKVVRTDFSESDSSRITNATPFTAAIGDANGDLGVSVLDILSEVSYILGQNPQPFIFDAADVARDSIINVLDVVGTVNIILGGGGMGKYFASESYGNAKLELVNNKLMLTTDVPLSGIQVKLKGSQIGNLQFINHNISGFENVQGNIGDTLKIIMYYNLNNNELTAGSYELGRIEGITGSVYLTEAVLADKNGNNVLTNVVDNGVPLIPTEYYLDQNFPNPFNSQTIIQYGVPEKAAGRITIYNILGQRVKTFELGEMAPGRYRIQWDGRNNYGTNIASGVYIYRFETKNYMSAKKLLLLK